MNVRTFLRTCLRHKGHALVPIAVAHDSQVMCAQGSSTVLTGVKKQNLVALRFGAVRARGVVVGLDALVPVTNVFCELSQRRCRVSERDDPFGIFRIVLKYLIEILPFVLSDTENTAMIDPKICGELL